MTTGTDFFSDSEGEQVEVESSCSTHASLSGDEVLSLVVVLRESKFEFCERVGDSEAVNANLEEVYQQLTSVLSEDEVSELELSKEAFNADQKLYSYSRSRDSHVLNGEIMTDSESDDPSTLLTTKEPRV